MSRTLDELLQARISAAFDKADVRALDLEITQQASEFPYLHVDSQAKDPRVYIDCSPHGLFSHSLGLPGSRKAYVSGQDESYHQYSFEGFEIRSSEDHGLTLVVRGEAVPLRDLVWTRHQDRDGGFATTAVGELTFRTTGAGLIMDHPLTKEKLEKDLDYLRDACGDTHEVIRHVLELMEETENGYAQVFSHQWCTYILSQFSEYFPFVTMKTDCADPSPIVYGSYKSSKYYHLIPARKIPSKIGYSVTYEFPDYEVSFVPSSHDCTEIFIRGIPTSLAHSTLSHQLDGSSYIVLFGAKIELFPSA